ncbi:MAG TPA: AAA family ATPase [Polyangia bacterium]|jgi:predicted ATPase|nr:AAA family ATPase [Polyangia bacterium]
MAISKLEVTNFTVFRGQRHFEFARGINVFIGENATGKSHLLKLLYAVEAAIWDQQTHGKQARNVKFGPLEAHLKGLFRVESLDALVSRGCTKAGARVDWEHGGRVAFTLGVEDVSPALSTSALAQRPVFLPTREMLSVFPGFAETIRNRELEFDETYIHLADALNLPNLKGDALTRAKPLLAQVEDALGGREEEKGGRFYVTLDEETFEAHLVAEGLRKVATLARLIRNGRISKETVLLWDEPETNLNPVLMRKVVAVLLALARGGVQVFLASHDYLLTQTLSLEAEHPQPGLPPMRFIGLTRVRNGAVEVEQADTIAGIQHNPILQEHARQYDLEVAAFERDTRPKRRRK